MDTKIASLEKGSYFILYIILTCLDFKQLFLFFSSFCWALKHVEYDKSFPLECAVLKGLMFNYMFYFIGL